MSIAAALEVARSLTAGAPLPGSGRTRQRWQALAGLAADDLTTARIAEAHLDAVAVLAEAGPAGCQVPDGSTWGVFAAESADTKLLAHCGATDGASWRLEGTKPWCSLAADLSHALVTAHTPDGRRLFAVDLATGRTEGTVAVERGAWHSRGLVDVSSGPVHFRSAAAQPVGDAGWYLRRPGFAHGGIGVAACWFGGAVGVARALARTRREPDQLAHLHRGVVDLRLRSARLALDAAAEDVDAGRASGADGELLAARTRSVVAECAEDVLREVGHALGPAPLTFDAAHAARVADLTVYLRQHHAERDVAMVGQMVTGTQVEGSGWPS